MASGNPGAVQWVYDVEDTSPPIDRDKIGDPFAATSGLSDDAIGAALRRLVKNCRSQKNFKIEIVEARLGHGSAGSAAGQGSLPIKLPPQAVTLAHHHVTSQSEPPIQVPKSSGSAEYKWIRVFRVKVNDRMTSPQRLVTIAHELGHIFCGHLGPGGDGTNGQAGWPDRSTLGFHEREMEAEAVAWLISKRALIIGGSAAYLKHHVQQGDQMKVDPDVVERAVGRIEKLAGLHYGI